MTQRFPPSSSQNGPRKRPVAPAKSKQGRRRITKSLVALSSAAILSIYGVGYVSTQSAEQYLSSPTAAAVVIQPASTAPPATALTQSPTQLSAAAIETAQPHVPAALPAATQPARIVTAAASASSAVQAGTYRDGTYVGTGSNRHADIEATVTVQGGRIVSAQITSCQTRYPCNLISGLPGQVVSRQKAQVNMVSGATDSSRAFIDAVSQALAQAA
jgi:uncharacterized protein with FMN-binding domain